MEITGVNPHRKHGAISYISIVIGIICFFIVFITPTRLAYADVQFGNYIALALTTLGIVTSIIGIRKKSVKNIIPIISLVLSSSFFSFWIVVVFLYATGISELTP